MPQADPAVLMKHMMAFLGTKYLFAATELGVFEKLLDAPQTASELADQFDCEPHHLAVILNALVANNLLEKQGDAYANTPTATGLLTSEAFMDMRIVLKLFGSLVSSSFDTLGRDVSDGFEQIDGLFSPNVSPEDQRLFSEGVQVFTLAVAKALPNVYDFSQHKKLLDIGGGTGSFLGPILSKYDHQLEAGLYEFPRVIDLAKENLANTPYFDQITFHPGNTLKDEVPAADYDVLLLANFLHVFTPEQNADLLTRIRADAKPGARLLLISFWLDETGTVPYTAAHMSGIFMSFSKGAGRAYRIDEIQQLLIDTGWKFVDHRPVSGAESLIVAEAV